MPKKRILIIVGTRPEAIKLVSVVKRLRDHGSFDVVFAGSGQHVEMVRDVCDFFGVSPEMSFTQLQPANITELYTQCLTHAQILIDQYRPDLVMVHGDTATCLAGATSGFLNSIPVAHVESGLRTESVTQPFPEEFNRRATALITKFHFAPTQVAYQNLVSEGVDCNQIIVTGNTVIDALIDARERINENSEIYRELAVFSDLEFDGARKIVLVTAHRRENHGSGIENIIRALTELANKYADVDFVIPVHLNPVVEKPIRAKLASIANILLLPPLPYDQFVFLMSRSHLVLTDSGGIQEEAPAFGLPVLVMRDDTERPEGIEAGTAILVGSEVSEIVSGVINLMSDSEAYESMAFAHNPYGDGKASEAIVDFLSTALN